LLCLTKDRLGQVEAEPLQRAQTGATDVEPRTCAEDGAGRSERRVVGSPGTSMILRWAAQVFVRGKQAHVSHDLEPPSSSAMRTKK
jgi:hypothetical protein